ncbi:Hypothetical predicted protein [Olea europaea subsp. europaea]|uniref:Acid phosphatase n=1 Tax=Olea europaea subsp. europaea TaxID=158383 RepID=A0A8S0UVJ5_OLEEU|nr:Hypothetical predicted protein [Olea europaea subsp. europaea]
MRLAVLFILATIVTTCNADCHILQEGQIYILRPQSGATGHQLEGLDCLSWRLAVETNNLQNWDTVPMSCEEYVGHYMLGKQYRHDYESVADATIKYAKSLKLAGDDKDIWIFDVDETVLTNIPYYARSDVLFGALPYNKTSFNEWIAEGKLPAVPGALRLYKTLLRLGFKIFFLTGVEEEYRKARVANLKAVGYHTWEKLILREDADKGLTALAYKSKRRTELVNAGYRILGNSGDQWSLCEVAVLERAIK